MKVQLITQRLCGLGIALLLTAVPTFGHHAFAPEFDWKKPVTLTGTVTKVEWANPHALISIDVKDAAGTTTNWALELGSARVLGKHYGWTPTLLKTGDQVTVDGWLAADGKKRVSAKSVTLTNGKEFFAASAFFDLPGKCISDDVCVDDDESGAKIPSSGAQR